MAYDEGTAQMLRDDLSHLEGITETKMFGGICFMWHGRMLCGVHKGGAMYRVGKGNHAAALEIAGASPMAMTGRPMGGLIDASDAGLADDAARAEWLRMAQEFVATFPEK